MHRRNMYPDRPSDKQKNVSSMAKRKNQEVFAQNMLKGSKNGTLPLCRFTANEIFGLVAIFRNLAGSSGKVDRAKFKEQLHTAFHITDDFLMDRIYRAFDRDNDSTLKTDEYIWGLSIYLRGDLEDKIKFCFFVYDLNGDGQISKEEMIQLLKTSLVKQSAEEDPDENCRELMEIVFKKLDMNHDGRCDLADFREAVKNDSLLLESLGQVLPTDNARDEFLARLG